MNVRLSAEKNHSAFGSCLLKVMEVVKEEKMAVQEE